MYKRQVKNNPASLSHHISPALGLPGADVDIVNPCLLYTSDAADEEDSVDLGGRRIIKKSCKKSI